MLCQPMTQYDATKQYLYAVGILHHEHYEDQYEKLIIVRRSENNKLSADFIYSFDHAGFLLGIK